MSSSEWIKVILGDIVGINEISISSNYPHKVIEYIDTSSVTNNRFDSVQELSLDKAPSRAKRIVRSGDTILSTVRPIQRHFGYIKKAKENTVASTGFAVLTPKKIHPEFLYYYLSQEAITLYLNAIAETTTTTFPAFRPDTLKELEVEIPESINEQKRIASILSGLDEKIELNCQTNQTLEAIAQAIYKEWFVNFNFPGATGEMQDSELGAIPRSWKVEEYANELNIVYGKNLPTVNLLPYGYPVFGGNGQIGFYGKYLYEDPQVIVACRGAASGKVNQSLPKSFVTNNSLVFEIPQKSKLKFSYLKQYCLNTDFISFVTGSAQPQLTIESFKNAFLLVPDEKIIQEFDILVSPLETVIHENNIQSDYLSQMRDALLPKLIDGEIEV